MIDGPLHPDTTAVVAGRPPHVADQPLNVPVHLASTYVAGGELEYGRFANPSWTAFEEALGALEGGRAVSFASGMAAIAAVLFLVPGGARIVAPRHSYTGTMGQLDDLVARGLAVVEYVDIADADAVAAASVDAAMVWIESPTNPALELADIPAIAVAARAAGAIVVVDNTFATPLLQRPLEQGADIVVHSATKYIAGHSDVLMGAVVTATPEHAAAITARRTLHGATPSPMEAFLALRGLRTLPVRLDRAPIHGPRARPPPHRPPRARGGALPGLRRHHLHRHPGRGGCRRRDRRTHRPLGARDEPRRCRVDLRASPTLAGRGTHHSRRARAPVGGPRTRGRPVRRPRLGPRLNPPEWMAP